jgi:hypothetical protein
MPPVAIEHRTRLASTRGVVSALPEDGGPRVDSSHGARVAYVLLTADPQYGGPFGSDERSALALIETWAQQVDEADRERTIDTSPGSGGAVRHLLVPFPYLRGARPSTDEFQRAARSFMLEGLRRATRFAERGIIAIAVGHGVSVPGSAMVDLAPANALPISLDFCEAFEETRGRHARTPTPSETTFAEMGGILREARVERVDLYTCMVGYGVAGQALLDWIDYLWGVRVRGPRGYLDFSGSSLAGLIDGLRLPSGAQIEHLADARVICLPAPRRPAAEQAACDRRFQHELVEGPGLWATSRHRRPAHIEPLPPSPDRGPPPAFPPPPVR